MVFQISKRKQCRSEGAGLKFSCLKKDMMLCVLHRLIEGSCSSIIIKVQGRNVKLRRRPWAPSINTWRRHVLIWDLKWDLKIWIGGAFAGTLSINNNYTFEIPSWAEDAKITYGLLLFTQKTTPGPFQRKQFTENTESAVSRDSKLFPETSKCFTFFILASNFHCPVLCFKFIFLSYVFIVFIISLT